MLAVIIVAVIAYLIGSVNFSVIISKKIAGFDVRQKGSGNAGTTNMLRSVGKGAAGITLVCDILKGVVAVLVAFVISLISKNISGALLVQIAGVAVVLWHTFPVFFEFKGGKGVATALGVLICINWQIRFTLFSICNNYNCCNTYGFSRFMHCSNSLSCTYTIWSSKGFLYNKRRKLFNI